MTVERAFDTATAVASQDLTGHLYMPVGLDGLVAETSLAAVGLLRNKVITGDHLTYGFRGQMKTYAGAAINSGAQVGVTTSGFLITVTTSAYVGIALASAASGDLFPGQFDFNMGQVA